MQPSDAKTSKRCCCILSVQKINDKFEIGSKVLDIWKDVNLIYFLKYRKHESGLSCKQIRRVNNLESHYRLDNDQIFYKKSVSDDKSLLVPKMEDRNSIIASVHCLGHFQIESTMARVCVEYH